MAAEVEAVIFDWGGTLTPWHDIDLPALWHRVARRLDDNPERAGELAAALHDADERAWHRARTEHKSSTLDEVFELAGAVRTDAALEALYLAYEPHTYADPLARGVLAELRRRHIRVGVLSNTLFPRAWHERIFERDGMLVLLDGAVYTSEIPWVKPHPQAFAAAMAAVGVTDPAAVVFVGDRRYDDIHGAKSAGMRAVLVPHSRVPAEQRGHVDGEPDAVIDRLTDLLPLLDSWTT